jgi:hypothetical protein
MTLQLLHSEFPYKLYEENLIFFFISVPGDICQRPMKISFDRKVFSLIFVVDTVDARTERLQR